METYVKICVTFFVILSSVITPSKGQSNTTGLEQVQILAGWQNSDGTYTAAVEIDLDSGWKTYWHAPGMAGIPPQFSFEGSKNLKKVMFSWPAPVLFGDDHIWSIGYKSHLILPMRVIPEDRERPVQLRLNAEIGICDKVCVPVEFSLSSSLRPKRTKRTAKIVAALASKPKSKTSVNAQNVTCAFLPSSHGMRVSVRMSLPATGDREVIMVGYDQIGHWVQNKIAERSGNELTGEGIIRRDSGQLAAIDRSKITLTVISNTMAADLGTCVD